MKKLKVGDKVMWSGGWGSEPPKEVTIIDMELCAKGCKHGREIKSAQWDVVLGNKKGQVVVTLDNGHWAYGDQLKPIEK